MSREKKDIIAVIPARGGSKGVIRKNIRLLAGKPLIHYTIDAALHSGYLDQVIVSTDDDAIRDVSVSEGATVVERPPEISGDESPTIQTVLHVIEICRIRGGDPGIIVLLQPTSPFRTTSDIDSAIEVFIHSASDSLISVTAAGHPPFWSMVIDGGHLKPLFDMDSFQKRRQDLPKTYLPNGAIFISRTETLLRTNSFYTANIVPFVMAMEKSVDIDCETDLIYAEAIMKHGKMHG